MASEPPISAEMAGYQAQFTAALEASAGFFYPYRYLTFSCNVWPADVRGAAFARAVAAVPDLAHQDVRFMVIRPGDLGPEVGDELAFDGGTLTVRWWGTADALSGEAILACSWEV